MSRVRVLLVLLASLMALSAPASAHAADWEGDGRDDVAIFRPSSGGFAWKDPWTQATNAYGVGGAVGDIPFAADMDGNKRANAVVYRPTNRRFYWAKDSGTPTYDNLAGTVLGQPGDIPLVADFIGGGRNQVAVYRPSNGRFYWVDPWGVEVRSNLPAGQALGDPGDIPLAADMDGNGKAQFAIFRPRNGCFYWVKDTGSPTYDNLGGACLGTQSGDMPVVGDMDGNGKTNVGIYRPNNGCFYWLTDVGPATYGNLGGACLGVSGDIPFVADMDGNKKTNVGVYRPSNVRFYWLKDLGPNTYDNLAGTPHGAAGDVPIPNSTVAYPTSFLYGGANQTVETTAEVAAVVGAVDAFTTPYNDAARAFILGLSNADRAGVDTALIGRLKDGDLVVNVDTGMADYYNYAAGELRRLPTMAVINAVGANLASTKRITGAGLAQLRIGADIGPYKTSWVYGGPDRTVNDDAEIGAALTALGSVGSDAEWTQIWNGLRPEDQVRVQQGTSQKDDTLLRDVSTGRVYLYASGAVAWVTTPAIAQQLDYDLSTAKTVAPSVIASYRMAEPITPAALASPDEPSGWSEPVGAEPVMITRSLSSYDRPHPRADKGYFWLFSYDMFVKSKDTKTEFRGTIHWYRSNRNPWKKYAQWSSGSRSTAWVSGICHTSALGSKWSGLSVSWSVPPGGSVTPTSAMSEDGYSQCPKRNDEFAPDTRWGNYRMKSPEGKEKGNIKFVVVRECSNTIANANQPKTSCVSKKGNMSMIGNSFVTDW